MRHQRLRHPQNHQSQSEDDRERQEDVEGDPREIGPKVADAFPTIGGEGPRQSRGDGDAHSGGEEILHRQPSHLRQMTEGAFSAVELPVGVGDEADGGVERQVRVHARETLRIERQHLLHPQDGVEQGEPGEAERQHRQRIGQPALALFGIDPGGAIEDALHRLQHRGEPGPLPLPDPRHVKAQRPAQRHRDADREDDLGPTLPVHEDIFLETSWRLELLGRQERPEHIDADAESGRAIKDADDHGQIRFKRAA